MKPQPEPTPSLLQPSRREFLKRSGQLFAASALAGVALPKVFAAGDDTIKVALVGCGGRGTGAAADALNVPGGRLKLVAMADVFERRLRSSHQNLSEGFADRMDVPEDRRFVGFDAYRQALDCLRPGDIAIFATPPGFRWVHFGYAVEKGLNVFMEKPVTVDGPTSKRMLALGEEAKKKNLKVGVGLMVRHCDARHELKRRIDGGEIGDIISMRAYRMAGFADNAFTKAKRPNEDEVLYQIRRFHSFLWASGGMYSDYYIHQIDECCWMKGGWPVKAMATGGRHYRGDSVDQNFDSYNVEYIFEDGARLHMVGRAITGCQDDFSSQVHGSKGLGIVSTSSHTPGKCRIFKGQAMSRENMTWAFPQPEPNPYQLEWNHLVDAIRNDKPYNEVERGVMASAVTSLGRMAAHTGVVITLDELLNCPHEFAPGIADLKIGGPAPLVADASGRYPVPQPGIVKDREY